MRRYAKPLQDCSPDLIGRPPRLTPAEEWNLFRYRQSGVAIKTCASFFRVSVPTANRIIAMFRERDSRDEAKSWWRETADASDRIAKLITNIPGWDGYEHSRETQEKLRVAAALLNQALPLLEVVSKQTAHRGSEVAHG
jgi:hypothetical protein